MLGLQENQEKQKFLASGKHAREQVTAAGLVPVVSTIRVLGVDCPMRINVKDRPSQADKCDAAWMRAKRIASLPVTFSHKCLLLSQFVIPAAMWGTWLVHSAKRAWARMQRHLAGAKIESSRATFSNFDTNKWSSRVESPQLSVQN